MIKFSCCAAYVSIKICSEVIYTVNGKGKTESVDTKIFDCQPTRIRNRMKTANENSSNAILRIKDNKQMKWNKMKLNLDTECTHAIKKWIKIIYNLNLCVIRLVIKYKFYDLYQATNKTK